MSKSRSKGTAAESAVVNYLHANGYPAAERRALAGVNDKGDIAGIAHVVLEVKDCQRTELAAWVDELVVEIRNANAATGAVVHKRRGKGSPGDWFATMPFQLFIDLLVGNGY